MDSFIKQEIFLSEDVSSKHEITEETVSFKDENERDEQDGLNIKCEGEERGIFFLLIQIDYCPSIDGSLK